MKHSLLIGLVLISNFSGKSQNIKIDTVGTILVYQDPRIDILSKQTFIQNQQASSNVGSSRFGGLIRGYRVQVLNTNNRTLANKTKAELYTHFPGQKVYIVYRSPFFRVRIGNFKEQKDAEALRRVLSSMFSSGVYIVPDLVEYRPSAKDKNSDD